MRITMAVGFMFMIMGAPLAPSFAQENEPAQERQESQAAPADAASVSAPASSEVPSEPAGVNTSAAPSAPVEEPAPASAPAKPEISRPNPCPGCFQPLLAGYNEIIADLKS